MYKTVVDISTARENLSKIIDAVYLKDESIIIAKRNIPLVRMTRIRADEPTHIVEKKILDLSLFGLWKNNKRSSIDIAQELRRKSWRSVKTHGR